MANQPASLSLSNPLYREALEFNPGLAADLAPFISRPTQREHSHLTELYLTFSQQYIAMRMTEVLPGNKEFKSLRRKALRQNMRTTLEEMSRILSTIPPSEVVFLRRYSFILMCRAELCRFDLDAEDSGADDETRDVASDASSISALPQEGQGQFPRIPAELDEAINGYLSATELLGLARVNQAFYRGVPAHVPNVYQEQLNDSNLFDFCLFEAFGPCLNNNLIWDDSKLHGNSIKDIRLNHGRMTRAWIFQLGGLLMHEDNIYSSYSHVFEHKIQSVIEQLSPVVSGPFRKIMTDSLKIACTIRDLRRKITIRKEEAADWDYRRQKNLIQEERALVQGLVEKQRFNEAFVLAHYSLSPKRTELQWSVVGSAALVDPELAWDLAQDLFRDLFRGDQDLRPTIKAIRSWPDTMDVFRKRVIEEIEHRQALPPQAAVVAAESTESKEEE